MDSLERGMYKEISDWIEEKTKPNERRVYNRCPVCSQTWHTSGLFSREVHAHWCWVPLFKNAVRENNKRAATIELLSNPK